jgi:hypothetical protein
METDEFTEERVFQSVRRRSTAEHKGRGVADL